MTSFLITHLIADTPGDNITIKSARHSQSDSIDFPIHFISQIQKIDDTWQKVRIDSFMDIVEISDIAIGDGDNDGLNEIYYVTWTENDSDNFCQCRWDSCGWKRNIIGTGGIIHQFAAQIAIGDGDNDGMNESFGEISGHVESKRAWSNGVME